jgi:hypothetical protein
MLMKQILILLMFFALVDSIAIAQSQTPQQPVAAPKPAMDVMDQAVHQARRSRKPILVMFESSWSDLCKQLDSALTFAKVKTLLEKSLIIAHINVSEREGQKDSLENPGGTIMMKAFAGGEPLLPFGVLFNRRGRKIADSHVVSEQQAVVYPAGKEQIMSFINLVKQYVPKITPKQIQSILHYFQDRAAAENSQP